MTLAHLTGHMVPAAGACAFVSLSACCWHSGFCWGAVHPFGPGSAQTIVGRKPMADSSSFRPDGSQCTWARMSCQPASWGGGDRPLPLLRLTPLGRNVKEDDGCLGEEWLTSEAAAQSCLAREGGWVRRVAIFYYVQTALQFRGSRQLSHSRAGSFSLIQSPQSALVCFSTACGSVWRTLRQRSVSCWLFLALPVLCHWS